MKRVIILLMIMILPLSSNLFAQKQKQGKRYNITGQVLDFNNQPVSGAIVLVDDKNTNVVTNEKGMYKVRVKSKATTISVFIPSNGQKDVEINGRTVVNFKLESGTSLHSTGEQVKPESEKVNVGYGYVDKNDASPGVTKIDGRNNKAVYSTIFQMLQRDPSVQVIGNKIIIRGAGSNNNTDPLLLVDGITVESIDYINPQMVKSIEILKGSEASIYGARGANGVIMITMIGNK